MMADTCLRFDSVDFSYSIGTHAIKDVSFELKPGKRIIIVGANGSGKSTIARLCNGLLLPSSGSVLVDNMVTSDKNALIAIRHKVGLVRQNPSTQILSSTVLDDISFGPENLGLDREEILQRCEISLEQMGLKGLESRDPTLLSGGQQQRVVIAGIYAMRPKYFIFDEPSSMLDAQGAAEVIKLIRILKKQGHGILHITHDFSEAMDADEVIVLDKAEIIFKGSPKEAKLLDLTSYGIRTQSALNINLNCNNHIKKKYSIKCDSNHTGTDIANIALSDTSNTVVNDYLLCKNVSLTYAKGSPVEFKALHSVDFEAKRGELTLLIGKTGSGKSTLLAVLAGLVKPDEGFVKIGGVNVSPGKVGVSFQIPEAQFFLETIEDEVSFGAKNMKLFDTEAALKENTAQSLMQVDIDFEKYSKRSPFSLSGGQARRVAIASVLAMRQDYILFDEPTAGLDLFGINAICTLLKNLVKQKKAIVVVTHDLELFRPMADRAYELIDGDLYGI